MEKLYMAVTSDEYELPMMVTNNIDELARVFGISALTIRSHMTKQTTGKRNGVKFVRVVFDEEEVDDK